MAPLGRKQAISDSADWANAIAQAEATVDSAHLDGLADRTIERVHREVKAGRTIAYGWSGGKDSQVLRWVMEKAGIEASVLGMTVGLEWPAMLRWLTDYLPQACDILAEPLDLPWLAKHPEMLFPEGRHGPRWFSLVQHRAQREYVAANRIDLLALGRRRKDGNYIGPPGADRYTDRNQVTRWSPIADWTHEEVFALIGRERLPLPPCYGWPRGYQVGTGPWPARQWTTSSDHGFEECWQIDPGVIRAAAGDLEQAADWMARTGHA